MRTFTFICTSLSLALLAALGAASGQASGAALSLSQVPLFVTSGTKANVLLIFSNSNSMDEDPTGLAVGSADPGSKSEIARTAARSLVSNYTGQINMGLMSVTIRPITIQPGPARATVLLTKNSRFQTRRARMHTVPVLR